MAHINYFTYSRYLKVKILPIDRLTKAVDTPCLNILIPTGLHRCIPEVCLRYFSKTLKKMLKKCCSVIDNKVSKSIKSLINLK